MNDHNLIPLNKRPAEERKTIQSAGGKASAQKRRELRKRKQVLEALIMLDEIELSDIIENI
jgi:hypothetical protein